MGVDAHRRGIALARENDRENVLERDRACCEKSDDSFLAHHSGVAFVLVENKSHCARVCGVAAEQPLVKVGVNSSRDVTVVLLEMVLHKSCVVAVRETHELVYLLLSWPSI